MLVSKNFTLEEFTDSQEATRKGIDNTPTPEIIERIKYTAECMEKVRKILGYPINISSGYRCPVLNKSIGGAVNSQHMTGEGVDFTCPKFGTPRQIVNKLKEYGLVFDQMILEYDRWVHMSFTKGTNRKQVLVIGTTPL